MSYSDSQLKTLAIMKGLDHDCNLFPNVRGKFFTGRHWKIIPQFLSNAINSTLKKAGIQERWAIILSPVRVETGLCKGASDMVGPTIKTVTQDMVGEKIAIFTVVENKSIRDRFQKGQEEFLTMVADAGGIAAVHRETVEEQETEMQFVSKLTW